MEVRRGYKQTEVGVIPEDWEVTKLGAHATFKTGPFGSSLHKSDYVDGGVPVINPMQIVDGRLQPTASMAISEQAARKLAEFRLSAGDVVIGRRGDMGRCAYVRNEENGWLCGTGSMIVRAGSSLDARFIQRVLSSPAVVAAIENASVGSTMINLNQGTLGNLRISRPPTIGEQQAIAGALSDADVLIESLEQLLTKKRQIKQGAMQELLTGKKRLPGFEAKPGYKQTEVGAIPEDWDVLPLGQRLSRTPSYGINAPAIPFDSRFPTYLRITDITEDGRFAEATKTSVDHSASAAYLLESGDLVFARTGASVGKSYLYDPDDGRLVFAGFLIRVTPDPKELVSAFLSYFVQTRAYWSWVKVNSMRSGQPGINGREFASLPIPLPPTREQTAIAAVLSDMDDELAALDTKLTKARQVKQGMMQELLTGRIRLV
jgi:type I restriction enzyme S subunit